METRLVEFTRVVAQSTAPMALVRPDGSYVVTNDAYAELLGATPADLAVRAFPSVTHPDDVGSCAALVRQLTAGDRPSVRTTKRFVRADGRVIWAEVSLSALRDAVGETVAVLALVLPADGPTAEQVTLHESEERFRLAFENAPIGMAVLGLEGECLRVNRALCTILGRRKRDVVQLALLDLLHPGDVREAEQQRRRLIRGEVGSLRAERRFLRGDGSAVWVQVTVSVVHDDRGAPLHFLAHVMDMSPHQRRTAPAVDHLSPTDLATGSDEVLVYRLRLDELHFDFVGDSVLPMMGFDPAELYADPNIMFDAIDPEDASRLLTVLGDPARAPRDLVLRWRHRDGRQVVTKSHNAPLHEDGRLVGLEGMLVDITGQWDAERARDRTEARFRSLVQSSTDALIVTDGRGRITYANPSVERILGWPLPPQDGIEIWRFVHPDDVAAIRRLFPGSPNSAQVRIRTRDGAWRWMEAFLTDLLDDPAVEGVVINARDIHSQRTAEQALRDMVLTDPLTGLPNRTLLEDRISRSLLRSREARTLTAVCTIDVDDFAGINGTVGYQSGDQVLVELAGHLAGVAADTHTVARVAGDEFVVCADGFSHRSEVEQYAAALSAAVERVDVPRVDVSASIGVAIASTATTASTLLARAGAAVAEAKGRGRGSIVLYDPDDPAQVHTRPRWDRDLRGAAARGELRSRYQPIVDLGSRRIVGAEALLRWQHPTDGLIPPDEFIPVAERSGAIAALGEWIVEDACRTVAGWRRHPRLQDVTVAVNLSARQLGDRSVIDLLQRALRDHGLTTDALTVEVTESAALAPGHLEVLRDIDALGITVALDDFGTHYSSLSYLQRLPLRQLKIDRSFVSGITADRSHRAIVMATAQLARGLELRTVAEGVEEEVEATQLHLFGVDRGQGYHFGRPMTAEAFISHAEDQPATR